MIKPRVYFIFSKLNSWNVGFMNTNRNTNLFFVKCSKKCLNLFRMWNWIIKDFCGQMIMICGEFYVTIETMCMSKSSSELLLERETDIQVF